MVTLAQLQAVDASAAGWCASLRAGVESQSNGHEQAKPGLWGLVVGRLNKLLNGSDDYRHVFVEVALGVKGGSCKALTTAQCRAVLWWLDDGGTALVDQIVASALLAAGQTPLPGMDSTKRSNEMSKKKPSPDGLKITMVRATYARTFNLGDYNSIRGEFTVEAEIAKGDDLDAATEALWEYAKEQVKAATLPAVKASTAKAPQQRAPQPPPPGAGTQAPPPPAAPAEAPAAGPPPSGGQVEQIETIRITAPKGRPVVEFWRSGRNYPEIKWNLGGEALMQIAPTLAAAGWTAQHFDTVGGEYQIECRVNWAPSPKNPKWKDISAVVMA